MRKDRKLVSERYLELFHYTSVEALANIYGTKQVWATDYSYLNDASEQSIFRGKAIEYILPSVQKAFSERAANNETLRSRLTEEGGLEVIASREAEMHINNIHGSIFGQLEGPFIASFCTHITGSYEESNGLLSQWRGYGPSGGVAIVFSTKDLEELIRIERDNFAHTLNHLGNVRYDHDDVGIREDFSEFFDLMPSILRDFYRRMPPKYEKIFKAFVLGTTLVKHQAFHEERESRIVVSPRPNKRSSIFFDEQFASRSQKIIKYRKHRRGEARVWTHNFIQ